MHQGGDVQAGDGGGVGEGGVAMEVGVPASSPEGPPPKQATEGIRGLIWVFVIAFLAGLALAGIVNALGCPRRLDA